MANDITITPDDDKPTEIKGDDAAKINIRDNSGKKISLELSAKEIFFANLLMQLIDAVKRIR